jgi:hypothetical protein
VTADIEQMCEWMRRIIAPDQLVEVRCLKLADGKNTTWSGHFRGHGELRLMCEAATKPSGFCAGVYFTLNPIKPEKFIAKAPRLGPCEHRDTATDADILERRWILIDVDPKRASGHEKESASDEEKEAARETAKAIHDELTTARNWPVPIIGDSGNGYHLLFPVESIPYTLPLGDEDPIRETLNRIADKYDTDRVEIDRKVYNPARICKFPGTLAMKGRGEGDRPHRVSRILEKF